jgi:hypothetical protein
VKLTFLRHIRIKPNRSIMMTGESKWEDLTDSECTMVSGGLEEFKAAEIEKAMEK